MKNWALSQKNTIFATYFKTEKKIMNLRDIKKDIKEL